jgi:hypothetical protein
MRGRREKEMKCSSEDGDGQKRGEEYGDRGKRKGVNRK